MNLKHSKGDVFEMNALDLLKKQHKEVKALFKKLENTENARERRRLMQEVSTNLEAHAAIEEEMFYPAVRGLETQKAEEMVLEAFEEGLGFYARDYFRQTPADYEEDIRKRNGRLLLLETSSMPHSELTRKFYVKQGYAVAGIIQDFYSDGDSMVIFRKRIVGEDVPAK